MGGEVAVDGGRVRGRVEDGVWAFLGIPYAQAPVGPLRWRPPQRPEPWEGTRDATMPGPIAPQSGATLAGDPCVQSEDCLHLSVWTPSLDESRRPVMVWLHGGGFTSGTAGSAVYRGDRLSRHRDVVVVGVDYRLGALGFLAHPALATGPGGARIFGNWALLDQIAALEWVRAHIASFGGDPDNVTVFGESSGAMCVSTLLAMPAARGLFRRAIIQSGPPYVHSAERAAESAESLVHELGMDSVSRDRLERVPADELVGALSALSRRPARRGELPQPLLPVVDGTSLPEPPLDAIARGSAAGIAAIVGTNRDEMTFFGLADRSVSALDDESLEMRVSRYAPLPSARDAVAGYRTIRARRTEPVSPWALWVAAGSDIVFRWPSLRLAAALRLHEPHTFDYLFTWESPALGGVLGATHALEIPFVFGSFGDPAVAAFCGSGARVDALAEAMQASWTSFARTGDPSCAQTGPWPAWDPDRRTTMVFGAEIGAVDGPRQEELAVWEALSPLPSPP